MSLEITVEPGSPTSEGLAVALWLRTRTRVRLDTLSLVGLCPEGTELGPKVLVPLATPLVGERRLDVQLRMGAVTPARVCCRAWLAGAVDPLVFLSPVLCALAYPGLSPELAACLDDVCIDHDEAAFQMFVGDFCQGFDPTDVPFDELQDALRDLMTDD